MAIIYCYYLAGNNYHTALEVSEVMTWSTYWYISLQSVHACVVPYISISCIRFFISLLRKYLSYHPQYNFVVHFWECRSS